MSLFFPEALIILAMLGLNAFFAAYEMALASVSLSRLAELKERGVKGAARAFRLKGRLEASLSVIQLGITLAGAVAAATGGAGVNDYFTPILQDRFGLKRGAAEFLAITGFVIPLSAATIVFGELVPKVFAIENKEFVVLRLSWPMAALFRLTSPVTRAFERVVKAVVGLAGSFMSGGAEEKASISEIKLAAAQAREQQIIGPLEERIVSSAASLSLKKVRDLLIPPAAVSHIPLGLTLGEAIIKAHMDLHTRFPVTGSAEDPADIRGYLNFKDIVTALKMGAAAGKVDSIMRPMERIPCGMSAAQALQLMTERSIHMAAVVEKDAVIGILTLEDIIRQLTGRVNDEYDRLPGHCYPSGGGVIAGGAAKLYEVRRKLGLPAEGGGETLAAWLEKGLGRAPEGGETVTVEGLKLLVRKTRRKKLLEAYVSVPK